MVLLKETFPDIETGKPESNAEYFEEIEEILGNVKATDDNKSRWKTLTVDMIDTMSDIEDNLNEGRPVIVSKKNGSLFYDRMKLFTHNIR